MNDTRKWWAIPVVLVSTVTVTTLVGCSRSDLGSEVSGQVTLDGKPIGPGVVVFAPADGKSNPATGAIGLDGWYSMKTSRAVGLKPGKYSLSVSAREVPAHLEPGERPPPGRLLTPEKYESTTTSGLEFEVTSGNNTIDIPLTPK